MFTGLVEGIGVVRSIRTRQGARELAIRCSLPADELHAGDSIAVQGVCLTLIEDGRADGSFRVQASPETLRRSTLAHMRVGDRVHLERAVRAADRLGGHLVQGHVDGLGRVRAIARRRGEWVLEVGLPDRLSRYVVEKGSVSIDGVSLTVGRKRGTGFTVHIVPATAAATLLTRYRPGRALNLEVDLISKYVESFLSAGSRSLPLDGAGLEEEAV